MVLAASYHNLLINLISALQPAGTGTVMSGENSTRAYYRRGPVDLLTEFTVCESLASRESPYMTVLENPAAYGERIGEKLIECGVMREGCRLCEAGGGYGNLMKGLLDSFGSLVRHVIMIDLSLHLLHMQRRRMGDRASQMLYVNGDIVDLLPSVSGVDMIILNEMIGDLDTLTAVDARSLPSPVSSLVNRYGFEIPAEGSFNFNMGAILLVEEICRRHLTAFIVEHASDYLIPAEMPYLARGLDENHFPREIRLKGHSEYTIRFSHLIDVATCWGREVKTGSLLDLVGIRKNSAMRFVFLTGACATEEQQIIYEFLDHAREYRWLIIE
jgi:hypothetical protein